MRYNAGVRWHIWTIQSTKSLVLQIESKDDQVVRKWLDETVPETAS